MVVVTDRSGRLLYADPLARSYLAYDERTPR
jgi:hypothetical protein